MIYTNQISTQLQGINISSGNYPPIKQLPLNSIAVVRKGSTCR